MMKKYGVGLAPLFGLYGPPLHLHIKLTEWGKIFYAELKKSIEREKKKTKETCLLTVDITDM